MLISNLEDDIISNTNAQFQAVIWDMFYEYDASSVRYIFGNIQYIFRWNSCTSAW